jgi:hypothetical protein
VFCAALWCSLPALNSVRLCVCVCAVHVQVSLLILFIW